MNLYPLNQYKMLIIEDTKWRKRVAVWDLSILSAELSPILNLFFYKRNTEGQQTHNHMKRGATSLIMREMHIKITMRCHLIQVRMAIIKNCTSSKCWGEFREKVGMEIDIATVANTGEIPLKLELKLHMTQQ